MKRAFTLIELLVVIAIVAILAAILFPVFAQAKAAAKKTAALSNAKQGVLGFLLYAGDNDDRYPLALWTGTADPADDLNSYAAARPYFKSEAATFDPMDPASPVQRENADELPAPTTEAQWEYNVGLTSDFGINIQFINPIWFPDGVMAPSAITTAQVVRPANALFAVDSVWERVNGVPEGGGNWQIDAPCWTGADGKDLRPGWTTKTAYWWFLGWNPSRPLAWEVFGGVWPWHNGGRQAVVEFTDGHVKAVAMPALVAGCDVKDGSTGLVTDPEKFFVGLDTVNRGRKIVALAVVALLAFAALLLRLLRPADDANANVADFARSIDDTKGSTPSVPAARRGLGRSGIKKRP